MSIILIMFFFMISFIMYKINRKIINPLFIVPFLWANVLLLYNLVPHILYSLQNQFLIAIFLWVTCFTIGGLLINFSLERLAIFHNKYFNFKVFNLYYWIIIIFAPVCVYLLVVEALKVDIQYLFVMLRSFNTGSEKTETSFAVLGYIFNFTFAGLLLKIQNYESANKGDKLKLNMLILMNVLLSIVTVARTSFLFLAISSFVVLYFKGKLTIKHYVVSIGSLVFLMVALTVIRSMISWQENEESSFVTTLSIYMFGGLPAFDTLSIDSNGQFGSHTFRFFYALLNAIGGNFEVKDTIYEYVNVPIETNVYTVMCPFFKDFGYYGIVIFGFIYGFIFQMLFKLSLKNYKIIQLVFAYIFPMLLMQFFGEYLFSNLSVFFQILIYFSIPYCFKIKICP